jgi:hypothetical protein
MGPNNCLSLQQICCDSDCALCVDFDARKIWIAEMYHSEEELFLVRGGER